MYSAAIRLSLLWFISWEINVSGTKHSHEHGTAIESIPSWCSVGKICETSTRASIFKNPTIGDTGVGSSTEPVKGKGLRACDIGWQLKLGKE